MNPIMSVLMQRLQTVNPQGYQFANQLMQNNGNPEGALKQMLEKLSPEQKQNILNQARSYGAPNDVLSKIQNMK